ncbi:hypothetical protein Pelo_1449 [Pelomyxa schiedti]|nr:hypothetical protein Pelo_1449 [Pelomyxa schiedti]
MEAVLLYANGAGGCYPLTLGSWVDLSRHFWKLLLTDLELGLYPDLCITSTSVGPGPLWLADWDFGQNLPEIPSSLTWVDNRNDGAVAGPGLPAASSLLHPPVPELCCCYPPAARHTLHHTHVVVVK